MQIHRDLESQQPSEDGSLPLDIDIIYRMKSPTSQCSVFVSSLRPHPALDSNAKTLSSRPPDPPAVLGCCRIF